jgi:predicted transglutaminase-like cysteine proteinase
MGTGLRSVRVVIGAAAVALLSCATPSELLSPVSLDFFVPSPPDNPWQNKIENWQARHHLDPVRRGEAARKPSELADAYRDFAQQMRRRIAADTVAWVQEHSQRFYRPDGERDHWATLSEVIESGGDDCDGLDLLTFETLRRMGFGAHEIYRAIVVEQKTGQHHMVTLWFENGDRSDPFVLDPTGVVAQGLTRLSGVPTWTPIELFDERAHYRVEPSGAGAAVAARR